MALRAERLGDHNILKGTKFWITNGPAACVLNAIEAVMEVAHQAVQAMRGTGFLCDTPVGRIFRDAKLIEIGAGTSEIRRMLTGREMMAQMG